MLRSNEYDVVCVTDVFDEKTEDTQLLWYCGEEDCILITQDKKQFSSRLGEAISHAGIVIYTDPILLERDPDTAVRTLDRIFGTITKKGWRMNDSGWISGECKRVPLRCWDSVRLHPYF